MEHLILEENNEREGLKGIKKKCGKIIKIFEKTQRKGFYWRLIQNINKTHDLEILVNKK